MKTRALEAMERRGRRAFRERQRAARAGLVKEPYRTAHYWAEVAPRGQFIEVHEREGRASRKPPEGKRGRITEFSRRSRTRMLKCIARTNRALISKSLLVTLTYPRSYSAESSTYKRHFSMWRKRLRRTFPSVGAIWKLEFQKRGAPHFHLLIVGVPFIARQWIAKSWYQVVGSQDERHLRAGTQIIRSNSPEKAARYASKYVAKLSGVEGGPQFIGRVWGVIGRQALDQVVVEWELERRGAKTLLRAIRSLVASRSTGHVSAYEAKWCFANGRRGVALVTYAAGLAYEALR